MLCNVCVSTYMYTCKSHKSIAFLFVCMCTMRASMSVFVFVCGVCVYTYMYLCVSG